MNDDNNDNIRKPDPVKIDRLIEDYNYSDDITNTILDDNINYDLETVLELSKNEYNLLQEQEEEKTIELIRNKLHSERQNKFKHIKTQLNKIMPIDKDNLVYYELILSIIEMYEINVLNEYKISDKEYITIFKILKTIRLPANEIENLKELILCE